MAATQGSDARGTTDGFEADLLAVARSKDQDAFRRLFEHFSPRLRSFLRGKRVNEAALDDIVQDAFANVWRRAGSYDPAKGNASTWIFTIARNRRIDLARRKRPEVDLDDPATVHEEADNAPLPDEQAGSGQMASLLAGALARLPPEQSDIVAMAYQKDMSHSEIATALGLPLGTVKSRARLALAKLRQSMEGLQ